MCDINELALVALPLKPKGEKTMIAHSNKRVVFVSIQTAETITEKIAKLFKQTASTPPRTQAEIDQRNPNEPPQREITARLKAIGI